MEAARTSACKKDLGSRVLKVNHAGENGAIHIYAGQALVARFTAPSLVPELLEFKSHEERHRAIFWAELRARGRRRCRSYFLCGVGGLALGFVTGLFGRAAMAATTVAVERVVLRHLHQQIAALSNVDPRATAAIQSVVAEEQAHHDQSASHIRAGRVWLKVLQPVVAVATESVIWLGMKL